MCCWNFWKGLIVFCVTFGLGVLVSSAFIPKECTAPPVNPSLSMKPPAPLENKNCVPVDTNLKYENLSDEKPEFSAEADKADLKPLVSEKKNEVKKVEKRKPETKPQPPVAGKVPAEFQTLVHLEKCFEAPPQK